MEEELLKFKEDISKNRAKLSVDSYMYDLRLFTRYLSKHKLNISDESISEYLNYLNYEKKLKARTINRKIISIKKFIKFLNNNNNLNLNTDLKLIKISQHEFLDEILNKSEIERLINKAEIEKDLLASTIFRTLFCTGTRVSELLQLKVKDVKKDDTEIIGKGSVYRNIFITQKLQEACNDYIRQEKLKEEDFLFKNKFNNNQKSRQVVHKIIKRYAGKCKIKLSKVSAHKFRHACAINLIELGFTIDEVAGILGHKDINTTKIYTNKTKKDISDKMNKLM